MEYLDFESNIKNLENQLKLLKVELKKGKISKKECVKLELKIEKEKNKIYSNLSPWQKVQISRHPYRPYSLDYAYNITNNTFIELHGDRNFGDDKAIIGGFGKINNISFLIIGHQKGNNTKERQYRRFGMPNPEGYRKALRLMKLAEKFNIPILNLIDTPGAFPGIEAEERGQGEAIARNIYEMFLIKVPIITIIIGEGASGGALGIGIGDYIYMLENSWYSVISPENCSTILWKSWDFKEKAAQQMNLTSENMLKLKLIDEIINEPLGGAHKDPATIFKNVKNKVLDTYKKIKHIPKEELVRLRQDKFIKFGIYSE